MTDLGLCTTPAMFLTTVTGERPLDAAVMITASNLPWNRNGLKFITAAGGEKGRAQVVQAEAAGIAPDVRMNPILLKPPTDVGSQVIVNGEGRGQMPAAEYFRRKKQLIPDILAAYNSLAEDFDIIVIEGAGSPAEITLKADDFVNMGLA